MPPNSQSFTTTAQGGLLNVLKNKCGISQAFDPTTNPGVGLAPQQEFDAIWDTGATGCVITQRVIDACGLKPIGMTQVHGVHGPSNAEVYLVNIYLPNHVVFTGVRVTKGALPADADMLIGMDIINRGDFAVTNKGGVTKFSFRIPSETDIDFVKEYNNLLRKESFQHGGTKKTQPRKPKTFGKNKRKKR